MTRSVWLLFLVLALGAVATGQQPDAATLGPPVGAQVPDFSGTDQFGRTQTLPSVAGAKGTMLVFYRSADW
ncbi:MAG: hypothetical protein ACT4QD_13930 [Acidobacteriota bacterium]